jgi:hypothetical protein
VGLTHFGGGSKASGVNETKWLKFARGWTFVIEGASTQRQMCQTTKMYGRMI